MKSIRLETLLSVILVLLSAFFASEVIHYFEQGQWVVHSGNFGFDQWPQPLEQNLSLLTHALGMFLWVGILIYQLKTRGKAFHVEVGYIGLVTLIIALMISLNPMQASNLPVIHGLFHLTLLDMVLIATLTVVFVESIAGILKVREKRIIEHRQHLIVAVMFTLAPGFYRLLSYCYAVGLETLHDAPLTSLQSVWVHEIAVSTALFIGMLMLVTKPFNGHMTALFDKKAKNDRPKWHKPLAIFMLLWGVVFLLISGLWVLDLLSMELNESVVYFLRESAPMFNLYAIN